MMEKTDIINYLTQHKEEFFQKYGLVRLGLFGSYSRDEANESSDIDILIEMKSDINDVYNKKKNFKKLLEETFHRNVDIAREKYLKPLAKKSIEQDIIYV